MIAILMLMVLVNQTVVPVRRILAFFFNTRLVSCGSVFFFYDPWISMVQTMMASISFFLCLLTIQRYRKKTLAAFRRAGTQNAVAPSGNSSLETRASTN
jgi:hypothetical protein